MAHDFPPVLLIGCGRMGGALAKAMVSERHVLAFDPQADLPDGVERVDSLARGNLPDALTVILAVKPQTFKTMPADLAGLAGEGRLFLSIMAGVTLAQMSHVFGSAAPVIRSMPNTPAAIGFGITAAVASATANAAHRAEAARILESAGQLVWMDKEADLDAVTAVSGSGPAFFYRFTEAVIAAGVSEGLSEAVATQLARQTLIGAARLCEADPAPLSRLREQVTSPGGTTAAGLGAMNAGGAVDALAQAVVSAAAGRSRELAAQG
jgi:pyrroline-5-carboxylate reductase